MARYSPLTHSDAIKNWPIAASQTGFHNSRSTADQVDHLLNLATWSLRCYNTLLPFSVI